MEISVLGMGCARCNDLEKRVKDALSELGIAADVKHVTDLKEIAAMGVLMTPGLAVDGQVVSQGKLPSKDELKKLLGAGMQ
jgi:small redox-active disulfide protein 2